VLEKIIVIWYLSSNYPKSVNQHKKETNANQTSFLVFFLTFSWHQNKVSIVNVKQCQRKDPEINKYNVIPDTKNDYKSIFSRPHVFDGDDGQFS